MAPAADVVHAPRLGVFVDARFQVDSDGLIRSDIPFVRVAAEAGAAFASTTFVGRVRSEPGQHGFALPDGTRMAPLPDYPRVTAAAILRTGVTATRRLWRALDDLDAVWVFGPHPFGLAFAVCARLRGRAVALGVRQDTMAYFRRRAGGVTGRAALVPIAAMDAAFRALSRWHPTVVVGEDLARRYGSAGTPAIVTTFCQLRSEQFAEAEPAGHRLLTVGRIEPEKNPELVVEVMAELERRHPGRFRLTWVGDGSCAASVRQAARDRGVDGSIAFAGYVPFGPELLARYREASTFLHVSWTEGVPQVVFEAMGCGVPVVATDVGGVRAAVGGGAALLVPPGDRDAVVDAVLGIADDADVRSGLIERGRARARSATLDVEGARLGATLAERLSACTRISHRDRAVALADRLRLPGLLHSALPDDRITVLAYHRIVDPRDVLPYDPGVVSAGPAAFAAQMEWVRDRFNVISLDEFRGVVVDGRRPRPRSLLVTFDDGYADNHDNALPVLRRLGLPAVVFVATGAIDSRAPHWWDAASWVLHAAPDGTVEVPLLGHRVLDGSVSRLHLRAEFFRTLKGVDAETRAEAIARFGAVVGSAPPARSDLMMTWEQIRAMAAAGVRMEPHTATHPILTMVTPEEARGEMIASMARLREELGTESTAIAYPNGDYDPVVVGAAREAGLEVGFTMRPGPVSLRVARRRPLEIARVAVEARDGMADFSLKLMGAAAALARINGLRRVAA